MATVQEARELRARASARYSGAAPSTMLQERIQLASFQPLLTERQTAQAADPAFLAPSLRKTRYCRAWLGPRDPALDRERQSLVQQSPQ
jgi:hypothetical protein